MKWKLHKGTLKEGGKKTIKLNTHQKLKLLEAFIYSGTTVDGSFGQWSFCHTSDNLYSVSGEQRCMHLYYSIKKELKQEARKWKASRCSLWDPVLSPQMISLSSFKKLWFWNRLEWKRRGPVTWPVTKLESRNQTLRQITHTKQQINSSTMAPISLICPLGGEWINCFPHCFTDISPKESHPSTPAPSILRRFNRMEL